MIQRSARRGERGFTLTELMITVAIVGILAMIAVVAYRKLANGSHIAEANQMLGGIKTREEAYRGEVGTYLSVSPTLAYGTSNHGSLYPTCTTSSTDPGKFKTAWGATCPSSCCNASASWTKLGVGSDSAVFYGYSVIAGAAGDTIPSVSLNGNAISWPSPTTDFWFVASAVGDTNADGTYTTAILSSYDNTITVENPND